MPQIKHTFLSFLFLFITHSVLAQGEVDERPMLFKMKGLEVVTKDSSFYANFRFRMQNRMGFYTKGGDDLGISEWDARVRRLRLRVDGYVLSPKIGYSIQLAFTRSDQDFDNTGIANIVRDAVVFYHFTDKFYIAFGQNKLPGNRQRVNSSGQLQFVDRSIVNGIFTVDRDFGLKAYYNNTIADMPYRVKAAITTGEGRSVNGTDNGLAYTGRVEILPLGLFKNDGDYSEGDLEREETPKLAIGGGYSYNVKTNRTGGQLGKELYAQRDMGTAIFDIIFKYNGWAYQSEFLKRRSVNPLTFNTANDVRYVYAGWGNNNQVSYLFKNNIETAFRYSIVQPEHQTSIYENRKEVAEAGLSKYFRNHRIKAQFNLNYNTEEGDWNIHNTNNYWGALFQVELGI
ncbi:porin [Arcticibacter eurypsychrophilus]|uniref:porin n=1 Tax=Arcticibacter eurypsychrophilus TaxID=1434752 RepID=UPI00084D2B78|nr:porin [Arcticibacter eurypsychrophilus]